MASSGLSAHTTAWPSVAIYAFLFQAGTKYDPLSQVQAQAQMEGSEMWGPQELPLANLPSLLFLLLPESEGKRRD